MAPEALTFLVLSSGSALGAAFLERKYEETLPLTCFTIVLVLYVFGLFGALKAGAYALFALSMSAWALCVFQLFRSRKLRLFTAKMLTPGFAVFLFLYTLIMVLNRGRLATAWDEFSHWMDAVKSMYTRHSLGTDPLSQAAFPSYPPSMPLFQYFFLMVGRLLSQGPGFEEWRAFAAFQIFYVSICMPFFSQLSFRKPFGVIAAATGVFLVPLIYFPGMYSEVYVDPFMGLLAGVALAMALGIHGRNPLDRAGFFLCCSTLVLLKEAGLFFALLAGGVYMADHLSFGHSQGKPVARSRKWRVVELATVPLCLVAAKASWRLNVYFSGASTQFDGKIDLQEFLRILNGETVNYRSSVLNNYMHRLLNSGLSPGNTGVLLNYVLLAVLTASTLALLLIALANRGMMKRGTAVFSSLLLAAGLVLYAVGHCAAYMYKFSEHEAVSLASFDRYLRVVFLAFTLLALLITLRLLSSDERLSLKLSAAILSLTVAFTPLQSVRSFLSRSSVEGSVRMREPYDAFADFVMSRTEADARIYFVAQESSGYEYWVMRYLLRPHTLNANFTWSLGTPFHEGDLWTREITVEEWMEELLQEYDYVILYLTNLYFCENFYEAFSDLGGIEDMTLLKVNRETGLLDAVY